MQTIEVVADDLRMGTTAASAGHDDAADDDVDWPDWIDDDEAVDRLLHDVVETLEPRQLPGDARRGRAGPTAAPASHVTP